MSCAQVDSATCGNPLLCRRSKGDTVLSTIVVVLIVLWLLGVATSYTLGGVIHILLVIAIIVILVRVIQGRNPLHG